MHTVYVNGHIIRMNRSKRWLPEDDEKLRELYNSGVSQMRMAIRLGRTQRAVEVRVGALKLRQAQAVPSSPPLAPTSPK
jgi:hypothetical protein